MHWQRLWTETHQMRTAWDSQTREVCHGEQNLKQMRSPSQKTKGECKMTIAQTITTIPSQILQMESTDHSSPMVALVVSIFSLQASIRYVGGGINHNYNSHPLEKLCLAISKCHHTVELITKNVIVVSARAIKSNWCWEYRSMTDAWWSSGSYLYLSKSVMRRVVHPPCPTKKLVRNSHSMRSLMLFSCGLLVLLSLGRLASLFREKASNNDESWYALLVGHIHVVQIWQHTLSMFPSKFSSVLITSLCSGEDWSRKYWCILEAEVYCWSYLCEGEGLEQGKRTCWEGWHSYQKVRSCNLNCSRLITYSSRYVIQAIISAFLWTTRFWHASHSAISFRQLVRNWLMLQYFEFPCSSFWQYSYRFDLCHQALW